MHVRERITVYLHTKCEMSSFVRTKDMTWAPKIRHGSRDPDDAHLGNS